MSYKLLSYSLSTEVKEYLMDMHFFGEIDYEHLYYSGRYKGEMIEDYDMGMEFGYFDFQKVPGLERDLEQIPKEVKIRRVSVATLNPNVKVETHVDSPAAYKGLYRSCVIIFPISPSPEHYVTTDCGNGNIPYSDCVLLNTDSEHGLVNNDFFRMNLQLWIGQSFEEVAPLLN